MLDPRGLRQLLPTSYHTIELFILRQSRLPSSPTMLIQMAAAWDLGNEPGSHLRTTLQPPCRPEEDRGESATRLILLPFAVEGLSQTYLRRRRSHPASSPTFAPLTDLNSLSSRFLQPFPTRLRLARQTATPPHCRLLFMARHLVRHRRHDLAVLANLKEHPTAKKGPISCSTSPLRPHRRKLKSPRRACFPLPRRLKTMQHCRHRC